MKKILITFLLLVISASLSLAGVIIDQKIQYTESGGVEKTILRRIFISGEMMRTEYPEKGRYSIIRLDKQVLWDVDINKMVYQEVKFGKKIKKELRKLKKQGKLNDILSEPFFTLTKTEETKVIEGYTCQLINVIDPSGIKTNVWITEDVSGKEEFFSFYRMLAAMSRGIPALQDISRMTSELEDLDGMPIETEILANRDDIKQVKTTVTNVGVSHLPDGLFRKPKEFKKMK